MMAINSIAPGRIVCKWSIGLGAGDAFDAGLLYGIITSGLQAGLEYGNAMAVLKMTIPQNLPLIEREDVDRLLAGDTLRLLR